MQKQGSRETAENISKINFSFSNTLSRNNSKPSTINYLG